MFDRGLSGNVQYLQCGPKNDWHLDDESLAYMWIYVYMYVWTWMRRKILLRILNVILDIMRLDMGGCRSRV